MTKSSTKPAHPQTSTVFFPVTFFKDDKATVARSDVLSLPLLQQIILDTHAATKRKLPWLKMARFGDKRTPDGCLRHNANVVAISGIELDYDGEKFSFDGMVSVLRDDLCCRALIYTSPSHTEAKPRWRILFPTSREYPPEFRKVLVRRVVEWFDQGLFARESFTLSQAYYYGYVRKEEHRCVVVDGDYLDLCEDLRQCDEPVPIPPDILAAMQQDAGKGVSIAPDDLAKSETPEELELKITCALAVIPSDDYWTWIRIGAAIFDGLGDAGFRLFEEWSQESRKYNARACQQKWRECAKMRSIRVSTIFWEADQQDNRWRNTYKMECVR